MQSKYGNCLYTTQGDFFCEKDSSIEHFADAAQCKVDGVHPLKHAAFAVNAVIPSGTLSKSPNENIIKELNRAINQQCALQQGRTASTSVNANNDRNNLATRLYDGVVTLSGGNAAVLPKKCNDLTNNSFPLWSHSNWMTTSQPFDDIKPLINNNICIIPPPPARGQRR